MSEEVCPKCNVPFSIKRTGYGAEVLVCPKCGYEVDKSKAGLSARVEAISLAKETEMGWEPSLTFFTLLLQFTVGAYLTTLLVNYFSNLKEFASVPLSALWAPALLGLIVSVGHGKNLKSLLRIATSLRSSYLGREVVLLGLFTLLLLLYPIRNMILPEQTVNLIHDYISVATGILGLAAMVGIYVIPARPCWRHFYTPFSFILPAVISGPIFVQLSIGAASNTVIQSTPFGLVVVGLAASLSIIDLFLYQKYRLYLKAQGDETRACLAKIDSKKSMYTLKVVLRLATAALCIASIPLTSVFSVSVWLAYTTLYFALSFSAEAVSRGLFYLSVGAPVGEERFLKYAKGLSGV
ncbi:MAG: hypothetical protein QXJ86_06940 [Nitrososphaerales archaeon]